MQQRDILLRIQRLRVRRDLHSGWASTQDNHILRGLDPILHLAKQLDAIGLVLPTDPGRQTRHRPRRNDQILVLDPLPGPEDHESSSIFTLPILIIHIIPFDPLHPIPHPDTRPSRHLTRHIRPIRHKRLMLVAPHDRKPGEHPRELEVRVLLDDHNAVACGDGGREASRGVVSRERGADDDNVADVFRARVGQGAVGEAVGEGGEEQTEAGAGDGEDGGEDFADEEELGEGGHGAAAAAISQRLSQGKGVCLCL